MNFPTNVSIKGLLPLAVLPGFVLLGLAPCVWAQEDKVDPSDLRQLSLEELMDVPVITVSRKEEPWFEAAAAVYVITQDELRRSGATSLPEALRLVPGMQVARLNSNQWAISARGFNNQFANKLLVLMDGRSIYTPLFAGVYWDAQDLLLENVERIEVIRGPGATLWGANAVNGIINIITKRAEDTPGWMGTMAGGSHEQGFGNLRFGGEVSPSLHYRFGARVFNRNGFVDQEGNDANDDWRMVRGGGRLDWRRDERNLFSAHADAYAASVGQEVTLSTPTTPFVESRILDAEINGGNFVLRWDHAFSATVHGVSKFYYDRTERRDAFIHEIRNTFDVDLQYSFDLPWQHLIWGAGYRVTFDDIGETFVVSVDPKARTDHLFSAFLQSEIRLWPERLRLTLGSKLEHNSYTGVEAQPSARLLWTPDAENTVWGAVSRAVRTPSRVEDDVRVVLGVTPGANDVPNYFVLVGNRDVESDELIAFELGYRLRPVERVLLDFATFYNLYDNLGSFEPGDAFAEDDPPPAHLVHPLRLANLGSGNTYGLEATAAWTLSGWWKLAGTYSFFEIDLKRDVESLDASADLAEGNDPEQQLRLTSRFDLAARTTFDAHLYLVDALPSQGIDGYARCDLRLGWRPSRQFEVSVTGRNLFGPAHQEFGRSVTSPIPTRIERDVFGKVVWRY